MTTIYSLYNPYGNYLDNYYVKDYDSFISFLLSDTNFHVEKVNLGIIDGVTIQNRLHGDYREYNCLIVEDESGNRDLYKIIDKTFVRRNIWQITAKLDVFSKDYKNILNADVLVKRLGYREYTDFSPLLFNDEGFTLSNIKKEQKGITFTDAIVENNTDLVLGDDIKLEALLLIFAKDALVSDLDALIANIETITPDADYEVDDIENWEPYKYRYCYSHIDYSINEDWGAPIIYFWWRLRDLTTNYSNASQYTISDYTNGVVTGNLVESAIQTQTNNQTTKWMGTNSIFKTDIYTLGWYNTFYESVSIPSLNTVAKNIETCLINKCDKNYGGHLSSTDYKSSDFNNKIVYDKKQDRYFKMTTTNLSTSRSNITLEHSDGLGEIFNLSSDDGYGELYISYGYHDGFRISFEELSVTQEEQVAFRLLAKQNTIDEGNPVLVIPYIETDLPLYFNNEKFTYGAVMGVVRAMQEAYMGDSPILLDVQKVPFLVAPVRYENTDFKIKIEKDGVYLSYLDEIENYFQMSEAYNSSTKQYEILFIAYALTYCSGLITSNTPTIEIENYKEEQVNKYILCSPSGSSTYEFSPAKNRGIGGWQLKYNIRPIETMIQVQPIYSGYYGANFIDTRGNVMLEDISLTQYSTAWETYKRENINYINSFESNINYERSQLELQQNYEKQSYKLGRIESGISATMNYLGSGVKALGNMAVGNIGDATADVVNAGGAIYGEALNAIFGKKQLNLQLQYETDSLAISQEEERKQWNYSLGNIQAIPTNTDKTCSIYNTNYGVFYYEKYEPTAYELYVYNKYIELFGISIEQVVPLNTVEFDYIEGDVVLYKEPITQEEYTELQEELQEGRRLYEWQ